MAKNKHCVLQIAVDEQHSRKTFEQKTFFNSVSKRGTKLFHSSLSDWYNKLPNELWIGAKRVF